MNGSDAFPTEPTQWQDSDFDGWGDNQTFGAALIDDFLKTPLSGVTPTKMAGEIIRPTALLKSTTSRLSHLNIEILMGTVMVTI